MSEMKNKRKEWKVYFSGNLWGHEKGEQCGREIPVGKMFRWGEEKWPGAFGVFHIFRSRDGFLCGD